MAINDDLRQRAEASALKARLTPESTDGMSPDAMRRALHELQVYRIELEIQNEELRLAQTKLGLSRERYIDLYDHAPTAYFTTSETGLILGANLTAATLLGVKRSALVKHPFSLFIPAADQDTYHLFRNQLSNTGKPQTCDLRMMKHDGALFWAQLDATIMRDENGARQFRIMLADTTERKQKEQQLREHAAHLLSVREEEKASIAREIHDDLGGTLTTLKMETHWLKTELPAHRESTVLLNHVFEMSRLIDHASGIMRNIITGLRPTILDDLGLLAALEWQAAQFQKRYGIECRVNCIGDKGGLDKQRSIELFRISQEALTNVVKHSGASRVEIEYHHCDDEIVMSIIDNGHGLTEKRADASTPYGILGITERADHLGGKVSFAPPPRGGFNVTVTLPLPA